MSPTLETKNQGKLRFSWTLWDQTLQDFPLKIRLDLHFSLKMGESRDCPRLQLNSTFHSRWQRGKDKRKRPLCEQL